MSVDLSAGVLLRRLETLYPGVATEVATAIQSLVDEQVVGNNRGGDRPWNEQDVVLITYADQIRSSGQSPLATLGEWLSETSLDGLFSVVHLLPFYPYSSDDGFSVIDYLQVDPEVGDWDDIARLGEQVDWMFDFVLNHLSRKSDWFQKYLAGESPFDRFFIEADPSSDLSEVVRPRSSPLLTGVETNRGPRHVWSTFSDDQIDLNYAEPEVLLRMLRVLLSYASQGARILRLDAVAFLWKEKGTNCMHLPQTHEVVKLMRDVVTAVFPGTLILTETNVPHEENVRYFGEGDEAHLVYQFSLPPLLLDAFVHGDAVYLRQWLEKLAPPPPGCTFLNFTASHDGIGVRPLEGLVPQKRFEGVIDAVRARGALVNTRRNAAGDQVPYELNITYVDALSPKATEEASCKEIHARRFLASQAMMLAMPGIPAVYFHSLVGTRNDYQGAEASGIHRRIHRHKYQREELEKHLAEKESLASMIYEGYQRLLLLRKDHPAFHPDAPFRLIDGAPKECLVFERVSLDGKERICVLVNFGNPPSEEWDHFFASTFKGYRNLLTGQIEASAPRPGECVWLLGE